MSNLFLISFVVLYFFFFMGREMRITMSVSSNSIVIEMIKKDTSLENRVILKNNFKIPFSPSFLFISIFFCLQKSFALLTISQFQKKKEKKFAVMLHSFECFETNTF